jgi:hypothetical protein
VPAAGALRGARTPPARTTCGLTRCDTPCRTAGHATAAAPPLPRSHPHPPRRAVAIAAPAPPPAPRSRAAPVVQQVFGIPLGAPRLRVSFLVYSSAADRRSVVLTIDGGGLTTLREGDESNGISVVQIHPDRVDLRWQGETFTLDVRS